MLGENGFIPLSLGSREGLPTASSTDLTQANLAKATEINGLIQAASRQARQEEWATVISPSLQLVVLLLSTEGVRKPRHPAIWSRTQRSRLYPSVTYAAQPQLLTPHVLAFPQGLLRARSQLRKLLYKS